MAAAGFVVVGIAIGLAFSGLAMWRFMPRMMLVTKPSTMGFNETVEAIQAAITKHGWSSPGTFDITEALGAKGVIFERDIAVINLCKADYAEKVLTSHRHMSALMPCSFAVWEGDDGHTYVTKMNTGLMGKLFGGTVAEVMGGSVAKEEHAMLAGILSD